MSGGGPAAAGAGARAPRGRGRWLAAGAAAYLAILAAVAAGLVFLHGAARDRLDQALGERLAAIATTAAHLVDGDSLLAWSLEPEREPLDLVWLRSRLAQLRAENDLAEITLCDGEERVLVSAAERLPRGERNAFYDLDRPAARLAQDGFVAATRLYRTGGIYQKSAHAPVRTTGGSVAGVLTVEGNADFFDALASLRRGAWLTGAAVLLFLTVMGVLLWRLQAEAERSRAAAWRQENLAAMGRMTAGIAHEIRNPLGIIRGAAQHLAGRLREAGVEDELAGFIPEEVDRLDRILKGYLAFGADATLEPEPVDLAVLARRTLRLLEGELAGAAVTAELAADPDLPPVPADPRRLQQVLLNLLLNARDAMPRGGTVAVRLARAGGEAVLTVADEGTGLQGAAAADLFAPFRTTKEKGSGLGLAVVRRIVAAHGGAVSLRDRDGGRGAVAEVRLPLAGGAAREAAPASHPAEPAPGAPAGPGAAPPPAG